MNNIYDNGAIMLGNVKMVKEFIKNAINDQKDLYFEDLENILEDINDLKDDTIVAINYDHGMGYSLDYWDTKDSIKESEVK